MIDRRWVRVGSTDFNPLGIAVNYELDAVIEDPGLGEVAEGMFLADLEGSVEMKLKDKRAGAGRGAGAAVPSRVEAPARVDGGEQP